MSGAGIIGRGLKRKGIGGIIIDVIMIFLAVCFIVPFLSVIARSFSDEVSVLTASVGLWPINFNTNAYRYAMLSTNYFRTFGNSVFITVVGTVVSLFLNCMCAFPMAHKDFRERNFLRYMFMFTMIFTAGLIPGYLVVRDLGLIDTYWALFLPGFIQPYNLLLIVGFLQGIPVAMDESARLDGASDFRIFLRIYLPMSKPVLATMTLFMAVGFWNDWYRPLIFLQSQNKFPLALYLKQVLQSATEINKTLDSTVYGGVAAESVQDATIILSTIPILIVYPFVQKYFVTGLNLGAVKG